MELQLTPVEAYYALRRIVEAANGLAATLLNAEYGIEDQQSLAHGQEGDGTAKQTRREKLNEDWTFAPEKGNVLFVSAKDCWGTNVLRFVNIYSQQKWKGGINRNVLLKYIFEEYCYNPVTKKLIKYDPGVDMFDAANSWKKPLFVVMVLEPLWEMYTKCVIEKDFQGAAQYIKQEVCVLLFVFWTCISICMYMLLCCASFIV